MRAILHRITQSDKQTIGKLFVLDGSGENEKIVFDCFVLELPDRDNKTSISRIPSGVYEVVKRHSTKYKDHFHVLDVEGRSYILIHVGNYNSQTRGCILVGMGITDINNDGYQDVTSSSVAMSNLNKLLPDCFNLSVVDDVK